MDSGPRGSGAGRARSTGTRAPRRATPRRCSRFATTAMRDAVLYLVDPAGPACHTGETTCFHRSLVGSTRARRVDAPPPRSPSDFTRAGSAIHVVVPVWREVIADVQTPVAAFLRLRDAWRDVFLLESVEGGERWARYSFVGGDAYATVEGEGRSRLGRGRGSRSSPNAASRHWRSCAGSRTACSAPRIDGLPPFHGGAVGFIGYDCVRELERLPDAPPDDLGLPDLALILSRTLVVFDHFAQKAFVIVNAPVGRRPGRRHTTMRAEGATRSWSCWRAPRIDGRRLDADLGDRRASTPRSRTTSTRAGSRPLANTSTPATSSRSFPRGDSRPPSTGPASTPTGCCGRSIRVRTCTSSLRQDRRAPRLRDRGLLSRATRAGDRATRRHPSDRRDARRGVDATRRTPRSARSCSPTRRSGPST